MSVCLFDECNVFEFKIGEYRYPKDWQFLDVDENNNNNDTFQ